MYNPNAIPDGDRLADDVAGEIDFASRGIPGADERFEAARRAALEGDTSFTERANQAAFDALVAQNPKFGLRDDERAAARAAQGATLDAGIRNRFDPFTDEEDAAAGRRLKGLNLELVKPDAQFSPDPIARRFEHSEEKARDILSGKVEVVVNEEKNFGHTVPVSRRDELEGILDEGEQKWLEGEGRKSVSPQEIVDELSRRLDVAVGELEVLKKSGDLKKIESAKFRISTIKERIKKISSQQIV